MRSFNVKTTALYLTSLSKLVYYTSTLKTTYYPGVKMLRFDECGNTDLLNIILANELKLDAYDRFDQTEINTPDRSPFNQNTPLLLTIKRGMIEVALHLMNKGAKVDLCDARGFYPIHYAAILREKKLIDAIIKNSPMGAEELKRANKKTVFYLQNNEFKPEYKTRDWDSAVDRGVENLVIDFTPDIVAKNIFVNDIPTDSLVLFDPAIADSRIFSTKEPIYSNLFWHVTDIVRNLNMEAQLLPDELQRIKGELLSRGNGDSPYMHNPPGVNELNFSDLIQGPQIFVAKRIFIAIRNRKPNQLTATSDNNLTEALVKSRHSMGFSLNPRLVSDTEDTALTPLLGTEKVKTSGCSCVIL